MRDVKFKDNIQFGIWKFLVKTEDSVSPQFACAQPVDFGVRIGNEHTLIGDVGFCGGTTISCDGALPFINLIDQGFTVDVLVKVNGQFEARYTQLESGDAVLSNFETWFNDTFSSYSLSALAYYLAESSDKHLSINNMSDVDVRLEMVSYYYQMGAIEQDAQSESPDFNPTFNKDENTISFCLSATCTPTNFTITENDNDVSLAVAGKVVVLTVKITRHGQAAQIVTVERDGYLIESDRYLSGEWSVSESQLFYDLVVYGIFNEN
ncbi:MAG: hypothetical protein ACK5LJ_10295, partial [Paracoccus sp. (in: a-proteobacteria)]